MTAVQLTRDQTVALATAPGQRLRPDAAAAWDAAVRAYGSTVLLTDSHRPVAEQERIFRDRYRLGNLAGKTGYTTDVRYWAGQAWTRRAGTAAAAVPGTSNHGSGTAVDVKTKRTAGDPARPRAVVFTSFTDKDRKAFLAVAKDHGWSDDEGRLVGEWWHLTYYPDRDKHRQEYRMDRLDLTNAHKTPVTGRHVDNLQALLLAAGYGPTGLINPATGRPDGKAGAATRAALGSFQVHTKTGNPQGGADYIVGAGTWQALIEA